MTPRWLSITDARKYCPIIGEHQLIEMLRSGVLKGGRRPWDNRKSWFIDRESLDRYLEAECVNLAAIDALRRIKF